MMNLYAISMFAIANQVQKNGEDTINTIKNFLTSQEQQPYLELNLYVGLVGAGVVLLPFFFISFMFKV